jgi:hypothetical protein
MFHIYDARENQVATVDDPLQFRTPQGRQVGHVDEQGGVVAGDGSRKAHIDEAWTVTSNGGERLAVMDGDGRIESNTGDLLASLDGNHLCDPGGNRVLRLDTDDPLKLRKAALVLALNLFERP